MFQSIAAARWPHPAPAPCTARAPARFDRFHPRAARALLATLLLAVAWPFAATAAPALGLAEAMRIAEREAPLLRARAAERRAADERAARAGELPDPVLTAAIDNLPITGGDAGRFDADMMTMRRVGVMQEWTLPSTRRARREAAIAGVLEADAELLATRAEVRRSAALAWIAAWQLAVEQRLLAELQVEAARAVDLVDRRLAGGVGAAADALMLRAELAALTARRIALDADRAVAAAELRRWLGDDADRPLDRSPDFDVLPDDPQRLRATIDRHAALRPAEARIVRAEREADVARAERRPDLRFGAAYGAREGESDMLMLEVGVGLPLFRRQRQDRDVAAREAERDAAEAVLDDLRRARRAELEAALARWNGLRAEAAHYRDTLLPLARDRGRVALASMQGGAGPDAWIAAHHAVIELHMRHATLLAELAAQWAWLSTLLPEDAQ